MHKVKTATAIRLNNPNNQPFQTSYRVLGLVPYMGISLVIRLPIVWITSSASEHYYRMWRALLFEPTPEQGACGWFHLGSKACPWCWYWLCFILELIWSWTCTSKYGLQISSKTVCRSWKRFLQTVVVWSWRRTWSLLWVGMLLQTVFAPELMLLLQMVFGL